MKADGTERLKILILGISNRALAASAALADYQVTSLDYFADCDQAEGVRSLSLVRDFNMSLSLKNLARAARSLVDEVDGIVFSSGIECEPMLASLITQEKLLGNSPNAINEVRNPQKLAVALNPCGVKVPETFMPYDKLPQAEKNECTTWLRKDLARGGGIGVRKWNGKSRLNNTEILQHFIDGQLCSATFVADGKHACLVGMTYQYAGIPELGASEFMWSGNVAPFSHPAIMKKMQLAAQSITRVFGLVGLNGIDFIIEGETPYILEVNPRCSASVELLEMAGSFNAFDLHVRACQSKLSALSPLEEKVVYWGKGILYARQEVNVPDTSGWKNNNIRDIPHSGEHIPSGAPICSLIANATTPNGCWNAVLIKAGMIETQLYQGKANSQVVKGDV
ncbi:MAG: ATP-grasp domain-containing protein [Anaerolineales bacterium]|nr:ATP-grasp domain-containing protein [Anaerolineales bacterium]